MRPAVQGGLRRAWFEQAELWPEDRAEDVEPPHLTVLTGAAACRNAGEPGMENFDTVADLAAEAEPAARKRRPGPATIRPLEVAKLLQVNDGVHGACRAPLRFDLPRRVFGPRLSLWKGMPVGTHFLTGC